MTDFVVSTDLIVLGMSFFDGGQTFDGQTIIDVDDDEALLIRQDGDSGDVFIVNTNTPSATLPQANSFISLGPNVAASGDIRFANTRFIAWRNMNNNGDVQALSVDEDDFLNIGSAAALQARILSPSFVALNVGPHSIGGSTGNHRQLRLAGNFVSGGQGSSASNFHMETDLTGFSGDTQFLAGFAYQGAIATQAVAEVITNVSSMHLDQPFITLGAGSSVTNAQTLLITESPAEGVANYTIRSTGAAPTLFEGVQFVIGRSSVDDFVQFRLDGSFTSGGGSNFATGALFASDITSADGDTGLSHVKMGGSGGGSLTTPGTGTSILAATLTLDEPNITLTGGDAMAIAATLFISGQPTEGTSNNYGIFNAGGMRTDGTSDFFGNITQPGASANFTLGSGVPQTHARMAFIAAFVSTGISNHAEMLFIGGSVTGFNADTVSLAGLLVDASITTQGASNTIADVAQVIIQEPNISVGAGDTITNAESLLINGAPTEGVSNYALRVSSGDVLFSDLQFAVGKSSLAGIFQIEFAGNFLSDGSNVFATNFRIVPGLIGAAGDTDSLITARFEGSISTQTATESIANIAQVRIATPPITDNLTGGGLITNAQVLLLASSPTAGVNNFALRSTGAAASIFAGTQFFIGTSTLLDRIQFHLTGSFTSGGSTTDARVFALTSTLIGAPGDTGFLAGGHFNSDITTQTATENIADLSQVRIDEPGITDNLTGDITSAQTLFLVGSPTEGVANFVLRATGVAPTMFQGLQFVIGDFNVDDFVQVHIGGTFTSGGSSTTASKFVLDGTIIGASGDTVALNGALLAARITTQTETESIADVAGVRINQPSIIDNLTGDITRAYTLFLSGSPTQGVSNFSLFSTGAAPTVFAGLQFVIGDGGLVIDDNLQINMGGIFTSGGSSDRASKLNLSGTLIGAPGDTNFLIGAHFQARITTQTATESIANISGVAIAEPVITDNLTGSITNAQTLFLTGSPTEGVDNFSLRSIGAARTMFVGLPFSIGTNVVQDVWQVQIRGNFTSGGASNRAAKFEIEESVIGVSGDTTFLGGADFSARVTTQTAAEVVADVFQVRISEPTVTLGAGSSITNAQSLLIVAAPTEGVNNYALRVVSGDVILGGNLAVSGAGPHAIGGTPSGIIGLIISETFTSDGAGTLASGIFVTQTLVGASGDTTSLTGTTFISAITTQTETESIANISQVEINEPFISDNLTGDITNAQTLLIVNEPTEGLANHALRIASGALKLGTAGTAGNPDLEFNQTGLGFRLSGSSRVFFGLVGTADEIVWAINSGQFMRDSSFIGWSNNANPVGATVRTQIQRDADGILALHGVPTDTPHALRIYNTRSSASVFHRMGLQSVTQTLSSVSGASVTTTGTLIPAGALVLGVTTDVEVALGTGNGTTGYEVGDGSDVDRWGSITGTATTTFSDDGDFTVGTVDRFTAGGEVTLTALGGNFDGTGDIVVVVHFINIGASK